MEQEAKQLQILQEKGYKRQSFVSFSDKLILVKKINIGQEGQKR